MVILSQINYNWNKQYFSRTLYQEITSTGSEKPMVMVHLVQMMLGLNLLIDLITLRNQIILITQMLQRGPVGYDNKDFLLQQVH